MARVSPCLATARRALQPVTAAGQGGPPCSPRAGQFGAPADDGAVDRHGTFSSVATDRGCSSLGMTREVIVHANVHDRIIVHAPHIAEPSRDGEILGVPGSDAVIHHSEPE